MAQIVVGPVLRYVGETEATVWVETDAACEVEVLGTRESTFCVEGHHYALVCVEGLERGATIPYGVALDGERAWPQPGSPFPPSVIRTLDADRRLTLGFASCRVCAPQVPPYTLAKEEDPRGRGQDGLATLAGEMMHEQPEDWPDAFLLLGDQVYADEVSPGARDFIRSRRNVAEPPYEQVADFEEYTRLYWDSWRDPTVRWFLATVPTVMIFDDHDVHDDWNTSRAWCDEFRAKPWWEERILGGLVSYWVYQHLGNLSPRELADDELFARVRAADDAAPVLREFAHRADRDVESMRWSFHRDFGRTRLIMMDSRGGRVLDGTRKMVDDEEWEWIVEHASGDFDHLLLGTSLPVLLAPAMHDLEAWNEAVCAGAWGERAARAGEWIRQAIDLEHWPAFGDSFARFSRLVRSVGAGERGRPPASIVTLSGDVHHAYLAEVGFPKGSGVKSPVYQAVCSPMRNPLGPPERRIMRSAARRPVELLARALAAAAGVPRPGIGWRFLQPATFDNHVASIEIAGREAVLRLDKALPGENGDPRLESVFEHRIA
ncbi:MAG: alkaline phosphatase family protein [Actinomycetota bacterium]|nr:alkaline phosphatase family protein [Actinomycetota bacterium]